MNGKVTPNVNQKPFPRWVWISVKSTFWVIFVAASISYYGFVLHASREAKAEWPYVVSGTVVSQGNLACSGGKGTNCYRATVVSYTDTRGRLVQTEEIEPISVRPGDRLRVYVSRHQRVFVEKVEDPTTHTHERQPWQSFGITVVALGLMCGAVAGCIGALLVFCVNLSLISPNTPPESAAPSSDV